MQLSRNTQTSLNLTEKEFQIDGMTCVNCQNKIQQALRSTAGVRHVSVSWQSGSAQVTYDSDIISFPDIQRIIEDLDYEVLSKNHRTETDLVRSGSLLAIIIALYVLLQQFGLLNLLAPSRLADSGMGYGMLFVVGLITSVHCVAMCGGINLSQSLPGEDAGMLPSPLLYNLGRVVSYTTVGFLLGLAGLLLGGGSGAGVPVLLQGGLKLTAGAFMVVMGLNMLGVFPWLRRIQPQMPAFLRAGLSRGRSASAQPFFVGLLNGLMPCGPLQSMQLVALASGSPVTGALSMLMFSLGTVPFMLGLGTVVSVLGRRFARAVTSVGAVLVAVLGLAMLSQGGSLTGMLLPDRLLFWVIALSAVGLAASLPVQRRIYRAAASLAVVGLILGVGIAWRYVNGGRPVRGMTAQIMDGIQVVESVLTPGEYPNITVRAGVPVRWTIHAEQNSINGCNYRFYIRDYGIDHAFEPGENIIEFIPEEAGTIPYTCWMGMIRGTIQVTEA